MGVVGRWPFPPLSHALQRGGVTPQGHPYGFTRKELSSTARSSLEDSYRFARSGGSKTLASLPSTERLSWGSSKIPLHRRHKMSPLPNEPSPVLRCAACQAAHSFRPCRSTRLRRFPPHHASQVCCTLQPVMGFAVFRSSLAGHEVPRDGCEVSPQRRKPFEAFPSPVAVPRHRGPSLLVVGRASLPFGAEAPTPSIPSSTSRCCSTGEAVTNALPLPAECCTLLPWASRSGTRSGPTRRS